MLGQRGIVVPDQGDVGPGRRDRATPAPRARRPPSRRCARRSPSAGAVAGVQRELHQAAPLVDRRRGGGRAEVDRRRRRPRASSRRTAPGCPPPAHPERGRTAGHLARYHASHGRHDAPRRLPAGLPRHLHLADHGQDGRAVGLRGDREHPFTKGALCGKVNHYLDAVNGPDRLTYPWCGSAPRAWGPGLRARLLGRGARRASRRACRTPSSATAPSRCCRSTSPAPWATSRAGRWARGSSRTSAPRACAPRSAPRPPPRRCAPSTAPPSGSSPRPSSRPA